MIVKLAKQQNDMGCVSLPPLRYKELSGNAELSEIIEFCDKSPAAVAVEVRPGRASVSNALAAVGNTQSYEVSKVILLVDPSAASRCR